MTGQIEPEDETADRVDLGSFPRAGVAVVFGAGGGMLGHDFQDFLVRWSAIGCVGPDPYMFEISARVSETGAGPDVLPPRQGRANLATLRHFFSRVEKPESVARFRPQFALKYISV